MHAILALEDNTILHGERFGAKRTVVGEVVFNTSMTGYQEVITDPSYRGQIVTMTTPHIGNVGVNPEDVESDRPQVQALVVREISPTVSNWRAAESLPDYLARHGIPGISEVDTRALTRHIRERGALKAALSTNDMPAAELVALARAWEGLENRDTVREVTCAEPYTWQQGGLHQFQPNAHAPADAHPYHVVAYDFGLKHNILRRLVDHGCRVTVVPATTPAEEVLARAPDGVFLSNGPGDPAGLPYAAAAVKTLLASDLPIFGICLGHQLLGLALGGRTYKLKFGHHGGNQPVRDEATGRVEVTAQNHNYAVDPESLDPGRVHVTHWNLNDHTVEGLRLTDRPVFSVQYHPEASPGPHDADYLFARFVAMMQR
ncbi:MAG: carbamoyl phosphate synthase small subunit [Chloroflexi bacterium HGW-Chloroflexi-1]|nr:MAG: carbamoyl phosphate synthase small subunit [Chloroflexi bacterium HGW-Chloroflexi-1]